MSTVEMLSVCPAGPLKVMRRPSVERLSVGGVTLTEVPCTLVPANLSGGGRAENGLLPLCLFRAVYVNSRTGFVILNPRRQHDRRA